jgi:hypothetical protein
MNIIVVNVTCCHTPIITVIIFGGFKFLNFTVQPGLCVTWQVGLVLWLPFFGGESREHYCDLSYKVQVAY